MSAGEVVHTSTTGGQKAGNNVRMSLLPAVELMEVAELYGKGAEKYSAHNWTRGYEWSLSYDALQRHLAAFWTGEEYDTGEGGTGLQHLTCAAFHIFTLMYFAKHHRDHDDRHIPPAQPVGTVESGLISITADPPPPWIIFHEETRDTLPVGVEGMWQSESCYLIYWFLEGEWWVMNPTSGAEDPWVTSCWQGEDIPASVGPFTSYVVPQQDSD